MQTKVIPLSSISINPNNPRTINEDKFSKLINSILVFPKMLAIRPIAVDKTNIALGGNMRFRALSEIAGMNDSDLCERLAKDRKYSNLTKQEQENLLSYWQRFRDKPEVEVVSADNLTESEFNEFIVKDNTAFGQWDYEMLANDFDESDLLDWGVDIWQMRDEMNGGGDEENPVSASLVDRFIVPPFSILDARQGYWQDRKKTWRAKIGDNGESRQDTNMKALSLKYKDIYQKSINKRKELGISFSEYLEKYVSPAEMERENKKVTSAGVSLLDPVMAEVINHWFNIEGGKAFDPFAGDTIFGFVTADIGNSFTGVELRKEQVELNNKRTEGIAAKYICDDGQNIAKHLAPESQDLLFSCPPYYDIEVYSELDNDASNAETYEDFLAIIKTAFVNAITCLKNNRFAVIVISDVRNRKTGAYYDVISDFKKIFTGAGCSLWNEIILIEMVGASALRSAKQMDTRKVCKTHQNILVFYKGDTKRIKDTFKRIEYASEDLESFGMDRGDGAEADSQDI